MEASKEDLLTLRRRDLNAAIANLWGAIDDDGTFPKYVNLKNVEDRIVATLKRLGAWPKDTRFRSYEP